MNIEQAQDFIKTNVWTFAKTMADIPHEWLTIRKCTDRQKFFALVHLIHEYGYTEKFYSKEFKYFDIDGYKYWTMDAKITDTDLINRAKICQPR